MAVVEGGVGGVVVLVEGAGAEQATASSTTATIETRTGGSVVRDVPFAPLTTCAVGAATSCTRPTAERLPPRLHRRSCGRHPTRPDRATAEGELGRWPAILFRGAQLANGVPDRAVSGDRWTWLGMFEPRSPRLAPVLT